MPRWPVPERFYPEGFGWKPAFQNDHIVFYQMNGFVLGAWLRQELEGDMKQSVTLAPGPYDLAHNVTDPLEVGRILARLVEHGGKLLRAADQPLHGGLRGYVADPDGHAWEIAWNPHRAISAEGYVTAKFGG